MQSGSGCQPVLSCAGQRGKQRHREVKQGPIALKLQMNIWVGLGGGGWWGRGKQTVRNS